MSAREKAAMNIINNNTAHIGAMINAEIVRNKKRD